jgi:hypothetical protein
MATITVNLPDDLKGLVESRASAAGCADASEYLAGLIEAEAGASSDARLEALLISGVEGPSVEMDAADFDQLRNKLSDRFGPEPGNIT